MKSLQDFEIFLKTYETGSISAAAKCLGISPAVASAGLKRLEDELGASLLMRSTRNLRLTADGEVFHRYCHQAMQLLSHGYEALATRSLVIQGSLKISIPSDLGRHLLLDILDSFQIEHSEITLHIEISDRVANVYKQPIDLAIRYGTLPDSNLVAFGLAPDNRRILCASPAYLARTGCPKSPEELSLHNCLCFTLNEHVHNRWIFWRDGQELCVPVHGNRTTNDGEAVRRWALAGFGIAYKSKLDVASDLTAGRLIQLCPEWQGEPSPLNFICADRRQINPAVQKLRRYLHNKILSNMSD